jgi:hypothetical protein
MKAITFWIVLCVGNCSLSFGQANLDSEAVTKIRTAVANWPSPDDVRYIKAHPQEAIAVLEPMLDSPDQLVRGKAFGLLAQIPELGLKYVLRWLISARPEEREWGLVYGLDFYPESTEVGRAFVQKVIQTTNANERVMWLAKGRNLHMRNNPDKEILRPIIEEVARSEDDLAFRYAVLILGQYRDSKSYIVLRELEKTRATASSHLDLALAMNGDGAATNRVLKRLTDQHGQPHFDVVRMTTEYLKDNEDAKRAVQHVLADFIGDAAALDEKLKREDASFNNAEGETQLWQIYLAAEMLASSLGIPHAQNPDGRIRINDVLRIRGEATKRLGM